MLARKLDPPPAQPLLIPVRSEPAGRAHRDPVGDLAARRVDQARTGRRGRLSVHQARVQLGW